MTDTELMAYDRIDFDKSMRFFDADGRLHVKKSNISKATVNPYYGREIPKWQELGLDPDKIYHLLRHPDELQKAAATFNNIPLLSKHIAVSAENPEKESIVGTIGSDAAFENPYLTNSLCVWDQSAIDLIENGQQKELSCAYRYDADMTPGAFEGMAHDGVMRNLIGNHTTVVRKGRAGSDVMVADENPFLEKENQSMKLRDRVKAHLKPRLAQDQDLEAVVDEVLKAMDEEGEEPTEPKTPAADNTEKEPDANDTTEGEKPDAEDDEVTEPGKEPGATDSFITKPAMDAAIRRAVADVGLRVRREADALAQARDDVKPVVGKVAMDSAEETYKFALDQMGIDIKGVNPSAYRAIFNIAKKQQSHKPAKSIYAADSANSDMLAHTPNLKTFVTGGK